MCRLFLPERPGAVPKKSRSIRREPALPYRGLSEAPVHHTIFHLAAPFWSTDVPVNRKGVYAVKADGAIGLVPAGSFG
jgi:hypothetical protein